MMHFAYFKMRQPLQSFMARYRISSPLQQIMAGINTRYYLFRAEAKLGRG